MKFVFFVFAIFIFSLAQASRYEVRVAETSTVRVGDPIRLGALISGAIEDSELSAKLNDLVVLEPMTSEGEQTFSSENLALTLRRKLSFQDLQRITVKIPENFKVKAKRNFLYQSELMREIKEQAQSVCSQCLIEFDDLKIPELKVKEEVLQTQLNVQSLKKAGSFLLPLQVITSQGRSVYWVTGSLSFYKSAPVAKRLIRPNERISEKDFEIKQVNVSYARDGVPETGELAGKLAARTIAVGQPIFSGDLKTEPAAKRGQAIKLLVGNDSFEVVSTGIAEETGSIGDLIKVKSSDTQKILSGVLVDQGIVRIQ